MIYSMHSRTEDPLYHHVVVKNEQRFWKRILIVDDDEDITITFKVGIENSNNNTYTNKKIEVYVSNNPVVALSEFKPNFYDLLLIDINMPHMNGFELCEKIFAMTYKVFSRAMLLLSMCSKQPISYKELDNYYKQFERNSLGHKKKMEEVGFIFDTFDGPAIALSSFQPDIYDLVLDIKMAPLNGFELYRGLVRIDKKIKVCFITAYEVYYATLSLPGSRMFY
jgi:CheY-like chemotaxis protein